MTERSIGERIEHRRQDEVHECVRPGCGRRAVSAFHVDAPTRLAGHDWTAGEFVDLCADDAMELRLIVSHAEAAGYGGPYEKWVRLADGPGHDPLWKLREWPAVAVS